MFDITEIESNYERVKAALAQMSDRDLIYRYYVIGRMDDETIEGIPWEVMLDMIRFQLNRRGI